MNSTAIHEFLPEHLSRFEYETKLFESMFFSKYDSKMKNSGMLLIFSVLTVKTDLMKWNQPMVSSSRSFRSFS